MNRVARVLVPSFFLDPDAEALLTGSGDVEIVWALSAEERAYGRLDVKRREARAAAMDEAIPQLLPTVHALHAIGLAEHLPVTEAMLDQAKLLEVVFIPAAGTDKIDVRAATDRGVLVINAPGANAPAVSEHAIGLMLALCRRIADTDRAAHRDHRVDPTRVMTIPPRPTLMSGKTLGVVGFGFIGRTLAQRCRSGFEMDMLAFDPYFDQLEAQRLGVTMVDELDELLEGSDFVSVNTPLTDATRHLIGAAELSRMKPTAFLINTARGPVIDTDALVGALTDRRIAGAGLDVTDPEPLPDGHALFDLENVVLTPHLGGNASELLRTCALTSARLALDALRGRRPQHLVNPAAWERHRERFGNQGAPMA